MAKTTRLLITGAILTILTALASPALADPCEAPLPRRGEVFTGVAAYVGDGDSFCVTAASGLIEIRVEDFNAPELNESGGRDARTALRTVVLDRRVRCRADHRSWDRIVATCVLLDGDQSGATIGQALRANGAREGGR